ncbi:glycerophosphodiester phosphodiesterase family protein [Pelagibacterium sp.]|uniref:glycerophosphodiester phosphodiesterase family protein n=1 Tax=Pelagibacterium sp. TaxID=1967288 RepID=UPI003BA8C4B2
MTEFPFNRPIAHRGLHDKTNGIIENSRSAFEAAINRGFAIECDVQLTQDGEAVVFHDKELNRLTGREGLVSEITAEALCALPLTGSANGDTPIRFADFLTGIAGQVGLVVEIKQQEHPAQTRMLAEKVLSDIAGYGGPIAFKSFDPLALSVLHQKRYRGPLGIITYDYSSHADHLNGTQKFVLRNTLHRAVSHFTFVSCERTALTTPMIRLRRALGIKVMSWTVRSKAEADAALQHADQIVFEGFDPEA